MEEDRFLAQRFEENRTHLRAVAYRMLGSPSEADDAVQEAWIRLSRTETSEVENLGGWLTTVVARVCLDMLRRFLDSRLRLGLRRLGRRFHLTMANVVKESVWSYPRPPRVEESARSVRVVLDGQVIAESTRSKRVLETSHPPVYYIPLEDVRPGVLAQSDRTTFCEFKGGARYYTVHAGERVEEDAAWYYPQPSPGFESIANHVAFYAGRMDECTVNGEVVQSQAGGFYGGWITSDIEGPFKGEPGTSGW